MAFCPTDIFDGPYENDYTRKTKFLELVDQFVLDITAKNNKEQQEEVVNYCIDFTVVGSFMRVFGKDRTKRVDRLIHLDEIINVNFIPKYERVDADLACKIVLFPVVGSDYKLKSVTDERPFDIEEFAKKECNLSWLKWIAQPGNEDINKVYSKHTPLLWSWLKITDGLTIIVPQRKYEETITKFKAALGFS